MACDLRLPLEQKLISRERWNLFLVNGKSVFIKEAFTFKNAMPEKGIMNSTQLVSYSMISTLLIIDLGLFCFIDDLTICSSSSVDHCIQ